MYMYNVWINEKETQFIILKTFYLCKVSFMLNIKCNIHNMNSLNKYFQFQFYKQIVIVSLYNISLNLIHGWKWLLIMQQTWLPLNAKKFMAHIIPV